MAQPEEQGHIRSQAHITLKVLKFLNWEENSEEEQFANLDLYMTHHNTYQASKHIRQEYRFRLHKLDDDQYYAEINRAYYLQDTPATQNYQLANQPVEP